MSAQIAGFTGTQRGMTRPQKSRLREQLGMYGLAQFHHGDCIGADAEAHEIAHEAGLYIIVHPPVNPSKRAYKVGDATLVERDYIARNHDIVDACDVLYATPYEYREQLRSGTWATVRYARKVGKPVLLIQPDGTLVRS